MINDNKVKLNFEADVFSNVYWKICDVTTRFRIVYGGTGAGKSYTVAQDEIIKACASVQHVLVIRKVGSTVLDSVHKSFENRLKEFGLHKFYRATKKPADIFLLNGSSFHFRGLDDPEKLKSIEGITRIVVEEASELDYEDFKELNRRVRGIENIQITLMFNPIDEDHWLKKHFFDQIIQNATLIHTTYRDNQFLLKTDIEEILALKDFDENQYNIYAEGKWGKLKTGHEFLPHFSYVKHTGKASFLKGKPNHSSWDFNVLPYQPMVLAQVLENVLRYRNPVTKKRYKEPAEDRIPEFVTQVRFFKEYTGISGQYPENSVTSVAEAYRMDFEKHNSDLFIYGDASGKNRTAGKGDGTNFKDIKKEWKGLISTYSDRVLSHNPPVLRTRDFFNKILADKYPIEILCDEENCPLLIRDLATVLLGKDGILKEMVKDKATKIDYQKNSHLLDCARYLLISLFYDLFKNKV